MPGKRLLWQLYPSYLLITFFALLAVGWYALDSLRDFYFAQITADLEVRARLLERQVNRDFVSGDFKNLDSFTKEVGKTASMRMTLVEPSGKVLGDSHEDPARMDNHASRPEIQEALAGRLGTSIRYSRTVRENTIYLAVPVQGKGQTLGVVRVSIPITFIEKNLRAIEIKIAFGGLVVVLVAAGVSLWVARRISRPLETMRQGAERYARGDLTGKVPVTDTVEIGGLAQALNEMAAQLDDRIHTITANRNELEAVLFSMVEGVLAVDAEERLISMNQAAARLLGIDREAARGKSLQEIVRNSDLRQFVQKALKENRGVVTDLILQAGDERFLQVRGTVLKDAGDRGIGAVIVFNDVTRLRKLERVRRDFVANVSHELKTPITSIKGFVETLQAGAINDPGDATRFLEIIRAQTDRLNAIIEDLLSLSRLEQDSEKSEIVMEEADLKGILEQAIQACDVKASKSGTRVHLVCEEGLKARVNPPLVEQAVVNLVDNAIKYSGSDKKVEVEAKRNSSKITIYVRDEGCGIPPEHLPRLFERFYRVDQARSRQLGGTGLGLAIVKHIAQAHGGSVDVESAPGKGSVFSIHLPVV